jgi:hypothetical protein
VDHGVLLVNATDELRVVWIDGVPIGWVGPGARLAVAGLLRGRYTLEWRTFLGDVVGAAEQLAVPGASKIGDIDAGAFL